MRILRARLLAAAEEEANAEASDARRSQVRTVDRSERIRTYNYAENRISDHRTGYKSYDLDRVLDGDLEAVIALLRGRRHGRPARRRSPSERAEPPCRPRAAARRRRAAGRGRRRQPGVRRRPSCSRTSLGTTRGRLPLVDAVEPASRRPRSTSWSPRRAAREPLQHLTGTAAFRHVELAVGPGVFVPRPETELLAGWAVERAREARRPAGRRRPVHRLGRDRREHRPRGARRRRCTPSSSTPARTPGPSATWRRPASTSASATWPTPSPSSTARSTWWSATRRTSPSRRGRASRPRPATTTRRWPCGPGEDGLDAMRVLEPRPRGCCAPAAGSAPSTPTSQGESAPQVFLDAGRWGEVRDHDDLAGRARYVTARLAR